MIIETAFNGLSKFATTDLVTTGFTAAAATTTTPATDGTIQCKRANTLLILPYGTGADDSTFDARVIGWSLVGLL
jgi:hypothetical protein